MLSLFSLKDSLLPSGCDSINCSASSNYSSVDIQSVLITICLIALNMRVATPSFFSLVHSIVLFGSLLPLIFSF